MNSLRVKLTIALLITGLSGVLIMAVLVQQSTATEFDNYVVAQNRANFVADMTAYYEAYGLWADMELVGGRLPIPPQHADTTTPPNPRPDQPPLLRIRFMLVDAEGIVILPGRGYLAGSTIAESDMQDATPIVVDDQTVGYAILDTDWSQRNPLEESYLKRVSQSLLVAMGGAISVALALSFLFARTLSRPLQEITAAIRSIARGDLEQQVPVRSSDEVGQVAVAINQMSASLARANQLRRQMTADIAHELRTPLSVVVGYLASMSEGLLAATPPRLKIVHDEAQHLQRLVEDLRTLSLADAGELQLNRQWVAPGELVTLATAAFSHQAAQKRITLDVQIAPDVPLLHADPDRILQVLGNLLTNALRYTPEQGRITIATAVKEGGIILSVADTGLGIDPEALPHIFERSYRADTPRHQTQSESGLGLAIARSIVTAHGGQIAATSVAGTGTTVFMTFDPDSF